MIGPARRARTITTAIGILALSAIWLAAPASAGAATFGSPVVVKSIDGGASYPIRPVAATPVDQTGCICPPGNLISQAGGGLLGTNDKVGFVYATSSGGVNFARSTNGAATFTQSTVGPASSA